MYHVPPSICDWKTGQTLQQTMHTPSENKRNFQMQTPFYSNTGSVKLRALQLPQG